MRNAERKKRTEVRRQSFEFGIWNVECGKKKENRSQRSDDKGQRKITAEVHGITQKIIRVTPW
jgi:hypothetical protein